MSDGSTLQECFDFAIDSTIETDSPLDLSFALEQVEKEQQEEKDEEIKITINGEGEDGKKEENIQKIIKGREIDGATKIFFEDIKSNFSVKSKVNIKLIVVTHAVYDIFEFLDAIKEIGTVKKIIWKSSFNYKENARFAQAQKKHCNEIETIDGREFKDETEYQTDEQKENYLRNVVLKGIEKNDPFVILDIGGYFSDPVFLRTLFWGSLNCLGIVEDTENGHQKYVNSIRELERKGIFSRKISRKIYSVARSKQKETEDYNVGKSIVQETDGLLRECETKIQDFGSVGVIGFGKIGSSIAIHLRNMNARNLLVYDINPHLNAKISALDFNASSKEEIITTSDLIFCATGSNCLSTKEFKRMITNKPQRVVYIASVTSASDELIMPSNMKDVEEGAAVSKWTYKKQKPSGKIQFIASGNAANFLRGKNVIGNSIRAVQAAIIVSLILLIETYYSTPQNDRKRKYSSNDQNNSPSKRVNINNNNNETAVYENGEIDNNNNNNNNNNNTNNTNNNNTNKTALYENSEIDDNYNKYQDNDNKDKESDNINISNNNKNIHQRRLSKKQIRTKIIRYYFRSFKKSANGDNKNKVQLQMIDEDAEKCIARIWQKHYVLKEKEPILHLGIYTNMKLLEKLYGEFTAKNITEIREVLVKNRIYEIKGKERSGRKCIATAYIKKYYCMYDVIWFISSHQDILSLYRTLLPKKYLEDPRLKFNPDQIKYSMLLIWNYSESSDEYKKQKNIHLIIIQKGDNDIDPVFQNNGKDIKDPQRENLMLFFKNSPEISEENVISKYSEAFPSDLRLFCFIFKILNAQYLTEKLIDWIDEAIAKRKHHPYPYLIDHIDLLKRWTILERVRNEHQTYWINLYLCNLFEGYSMEAVECACEVFQSFFASGSSNLPFGDPLRHPNGLANIITIEREEKIIQNTISKLGEYYQNILQESEKAFDCYKYLLDINDINNINNDLIDASDLRECHFIHGCIIAHLKLKYLEKEVSIEEHRNARKKLERLLEKKEIKSDYSLSYKLVTTYMWLYYLTCCRGYLKLANSNDRIQSSPVRHHFDFNTHVKPKMGLIGEVKEKDDFVESAIEPYSILYNHTYGKLLSLGIKDALLTTPSPKLSDNISVLDKYYKQLDGIKYWQSKSAINYGRALVNIIDLEQINAVSSEKLKLAIDRARKALRYFRKKGISEKDIESTTLLLVNLQKNLVKIKNTPSRK